MSGLNLAVGFRLIGLHLKPGDEKAGDLAQVYASRSLSRWVCGREEGRASIQQRRGHLYAVILGAFPAAHPMSQQVRQVSRA